MKPETTAEAIAALREEFHALVSDPLTFRIAFVALAPVIAFVEGYAACRASSTVEFLAWLVAGGSLVFAHSQCVKNERHDIMPP